MVIGIITLLLALLLGTLRNVREQANQTKCAAQLHQLGVALSNYAAEHKGSLPAWSGWHVYPPGSSPEDEPGEAWTEQLTPYLAKPDSPVYDCPSSGAPWITYFISGRWSASQRRHSMKLSEIRRSAEFVLGGENTNKHLYAPPYGDAQRTTNDCDQDDAGLPCACFPGDDGGFLQHKGGNNILFGDLHVGAFKSFDPSAMTYDPRQLRTWAQVTPP